MNFKSFIYVFLALLLFYNCSSGGDDPVAQPDPDPNPDPNPTTKVTYSADIKSVIDSRCISCHGNPVSQGAPYSLTTYTQVKNNISSIISRINSSSNPMPPAPNSPLSQAQKDLIQQWNNDGLLEN